MSKKAAIPAAIRAHVMTAFSCCVACGQWDATHCGHVVPESKGGKMTKENFVRLCHACNAVQGNAHVVFAEYATYTESRAEIEVRRAYWARYCSAARGQVKLNPYRPA